MFSIFRMLRDLVLRWLPISVSAHMVPADFVFIVHPRDIPDVARQYAWARFLPARLVAVLTRNLWPILGPKITGATTKAGNPLRGQVIFVPMVPDQMFKDLHLARKRVYQAIALGEHLGPKVIAVGGLCPAIIRGKWKLLDSVKPLITTGRIYSSVLAAQDLTRVAERIGLNLPSATIAVVGAAGATGALVSKLLVEQIGRLILIDRRLNVLKDVSDHLRQIRPTIQIELSSEIKSIETADAVVAAASSAGAIIEPHHLKTGTVIVDCGQPHNVTEDLMAKRQDIVVVEGGLAKLAGIKCQFDFGLLAEDELFGCLSEAVLLCWSEKYKRHGFEGRSELQLAKEFFEIGKMLGFLRPPLRFGSHAITDAELDRVRDVRRVKKDQSKTP
jgi:fatty aldehyde-generating acyl-ACP reductase